MDNYIGAFLGLHTKHTCTYESYTFAFSSPLSGYKKAFQSLNSETRWDRSLFNSHPLISRTLFPPL